MNIPPICFSSNETFKGKIIPFEERAPRKKQSFKQDNKYREIPSSAYRAAFAPETVSITILGQKLDPEDAKKFVELRQQILDELKEKNKRNIKFYKAQLEEKPGIKEFPESDEMKRQTVLRELSEKQSAEEFAANVLTSISGDTKKKIALGLIECEEKHKARLPEEAHEYCTNLFAISKTPNGFDLSNLGKKREILDLANEVGQDFSKDEFTRELIHSSITENSTCDLELAYKTIVLIRKGGCYVSPKRASDLIKEFTSKDPARKEEIFNEMLKYINGYFDIDYNPPAYEDILSLCFTEEGFNPERAQKVREACSYVSDWISYCDDTSDNYDSCLKLGHDLICDYFNSENEAEDFELFFSEKCNKFFDDTEFEKAPSF